MTVRLVALGDSTSCGEGVGVRTPRRATWPALLAAAVPDGELLSLAAPGARVRDVLAEQLAPAVAAAPDVVTLLVGLNDLSRAGFRPAAYAQDLQALVDGLAGTGAVVLLGRLHDACLQLPLPPALRRAVRRRTAQVNAAVDLAARSPLVRVLDLAAVPGLRHRPAWDVDRLHPSAAGHELIAAQAAEVLRSVGHLVRPTPSTAARPVPGVLREARWLLRDGLPWAVRHLPQRVLPQP